MCHALKMLTASGSGRVWTEEFGPIPPLVGDIYYPLQLTFIYLYPHFLFSDSDPGGLERGFVQRYGSHFTTCCALLRSPHDFWKLCPLQPAGGHLG